MPSSRSSSLSRSNIRLNASNESGYPGTAARIWLAVRYRREESRQTTRLSSRSVFCFDIVHPSAHTAVPRIDGTALKQAHGGLSTTGAPRAEGRGAGWTDERGAQRRARREDGAL